MTNLRALADECRRAADSGNPATMIDTLIKVGAVLLRLAAGRGTTWPQEPFGPRAGSPREEA